MRILVTGGAGYIGTCVVEELLKRGHRVHVMDMFYWGHQPLEDFYGDIKVMKGDCRNSKDVVWALEDVDAVIHLAALVGEAACLKEPKAHFATNIEATRTLVNCCTDPSYKLTKDFIFASTCSIYGNTSGIHDKVTEATEPNPLSDYAHAKLRSENILLSKADKIKHFHPTILRLTTAFGWSRRPRLDLVTNLLTYKAWKDGEITIYGSGEQYRSLVHVNDLAEVFADVLEAPRFMRSGKIFHVGSQDNNITINSIANTIQGEIPATKINHVEKVTDRRDYFIDCRKLKKTFDWQPDWSVEDGILDLIEHLETEDLDWKSSRYRNDDFQYF